MIRKYRVTLALVGVLLVGALAGELRDVGPVIRRFAGTGYEPLLEGRWWSPLTSVFLTDGWVELLLVLAAVIVGVGFSERVMGSLRTVAAFALTTVLGTAIGAGLQWVLDVTGELWARHVTEFVTLDPMTAVAGTLMTASAFAGPLWRRRIRVVVLVTASVFVLYSGEPSDLYRLLAALVGFVFGAMQRNALTSVRWQRSSHHESRVLLASITAITAVAPAITIFSHSRFGALAPLGLLLTDAMPGRPGSENDCSALDITHACLADISLERISGVGPVLLTVLPLLTLLVAALLLARGNRLGVWLAVTVNVALGALAAYFYGFLPRSGAQFVFHAPAGRYWEVGVALAVSVLLPLVIAGMLLAGIRHFSILPSARRVRSYLVSILVALVTLSALYAGVGYALRDSFTPRVTLADLLADLPERFVPIGFLHLERLSFLPTSAASSTLYYWVGPCFWLVVIVGALLAARGGDTSRASGLPAVRALLRAGGGGSLGYWSTWAGNSYWFSADGRAAVAYRVVNNVAISSSEPIGPADAAASAIRQFATFCDDNGWTPVLYSIHESFAEECRAMGWSIMRVGEETIIRPGEWKTTGKRWQDVRSSINRAEREGVRSEWTSFDALSTVHASQINEMSEQWVAEKELPEMGFTLGGIEELRDPEVRIMMACDSADRVVGVTSWLPSHRDGVVVGWTLDFMRRTPDGPNGIMEFLIARSAERFRDDGIETMSLSAAPLAQTESAAPEVAAARILNYIGAKLEPVYGFRSLFQFKRKFQPEFHPLSMAYPDALVLPAVGVALARAYVPSLSLARSIQFVRSL